MSRNLPSKPNLGQLKNQAKDVLKAFHNGEKSVCTTLKLLNRFAGLSNEEILKSDLSLTEVQFALAMDYGFKSWNAMVQHVNAGRIVKPESRVKNENGKVWIDGIPKLSWGESGNCTFAGALSAALSITQHPYSYSSIMGYTGLAFRVRWYRRTDINDWCPSSPVGEFKTEIDTVRATTGWQFDYINKMGEDNPDMGQYGPDIIKSIDAGLPVLGYVEDLDAAVLYGYEKRNDGTYLIWNNYNHNQPMIRHQDKTGPWLMMFKEHIQSPDKIDNFLQALQSSNWRRREWIPENYPEKREHSYLYGDKALTTWRDDIKQSDSFSQPEREKLFFVGWWCFTNLVDARRQAATFLNDHADLFESKSRKLLYSAADIYRREVKLMGNVFKNQDAFLGPWSGKKIEDWTEEVRQCECDILNQVRQFDNEAVKQIDKAIKKHTESIKNK